MNACGPLVVMCGRVLYKDSHRLPLVVSVKSGSICTELPSEYNKGSNVANASNELPSENVANASNELPSENVSNANNVIDGLGTRGFAPNKCRKDMSINIIGNIMVVNTRGRVSVPLRGRGSNVSMR
ncbi:hypothetical protein GH714_022560 [Hevea brasiliensis]|uniref:Uncharacterized protein n=1 Tax=Hevea brasiliensis TaxID=3981 RepID=A0A6A6LA66_HEVBR|nr:hypothetical protein GH714_022560 [Hevea brasiliensis]